MLQAGISLQIRHGLHSKQHVGKLSISMTGFVWSRLKEQQLVEAEESAGVLNKGRESAERATESARQAKQRMESELARMQRLVAELEHAKRCASTVFISRHWSTLHAAALLQIHLQLPQRRGHFSS